MKAIVWWDDQDKQNEGWTVDYKCNGEPCREPLECANQYRSNSAREEAAKLLGIAVDEVMHWRSIASLDAEFDDLEDICINERREEP